MNEIQDNLATEKNMEKATYSDLATPWIRHIVFIAMGIAICQQISGVNSIMYYGTQILTEAGFSTQAALIGNVANGVISVTATFFGIWMLGRHGRRPLILGLLFTFKFVPETKGRSLEQIEKDFRGIEDGKKVHAAVVEH